MAPSTRLVLFTGKGGVGKTTTAAATAVRAAREGVSTLILSTDAAHSLGDALGVELAPGEATQVAPQLHALQVSAARRLDASWRLVQDYLLEVLATVGVAPAVAEELTSLPGAEEVAALLELRARAASGEWDLVVVDCAPTAESLRLLALPEALAWHLERLLPAQRGLLRTLRPAAAAAVGMPLPDPAVTATVARWAREMREVHALLTGDMASVRLVLTPERVVVAEARRAWTSLGLYGFTVDGVVVNRILPSAGEPTTAPPVGEPSPRDWLTSWNAAQQAGLAEVRESFAGLPISRTPFLPEEPIGLDALDELAELGGLGPLAPPAPTPDTRPGGLQVDRTRTGYRLRLPLPFVTADEVDLKRRESELIVAVGDHRRVLALPAALTRCVVSAARVTGGRLVVDFVPDEALWRPEAVTAGE